MSADALIPLDEENTPFIFNLGRKIDPAIHEDFLLDERQLAVHSCILGQSGSGKSKFLEQLMRYLMVSDRGFALIDPHGDLSEDLLAFAAYRKIEKRDERLFSRIHYLEPSYEQVFHYDPFRFSPAKAIPDDKKEDAFRNWLHTKADRIGEIVQRKQGDSSFQSMGRLQRVLTNLLIAVGTPVDSHGKHLPFADALVLLDLDHVRHFEVYSRVEPFLAEDIQSEFRRFHGYKNRRQFFDEAESTINRLRSLLSPLVKSIFSEQVNTIDFNSIIQNGEILLVNLRETDYFSADQANAIGGLFIHELLTTAQNAPRDSRKKFYTIIDEAGEFIGADVQRALGIMRKFEMPICLAAQDLSSFKKGEDLDLRPKVLSQCGTIVSFRQTWPEDMDILVRVMGTGNLDFTELTHEVDRDDGYEFLPMKEYSQSFNYTDNWSETMGRSEVHTVSRQGSRGESTQESYQEARSQQLGSMAGQSFRPDGMAGNASEQQSISFGASRTRGGGSGRSTNESEGDSEANGVNTTSGKGASRGRGLSVSYKMLPLSRKRIEIQKTGQLQRSIADQFEFLKFQLEGVDVGQAVAKLRGVRKAFVFETVHVQEHWTFQDKFKVIERMKVRLTEMRSYFASASLGTDAQNKRLDHFVADTESPVLQPGSTGDIEKTPFDE